MVFDASVAGGGTFQPALQGLAISVEGIQAEQEVLKQDVLTLSSTTNTLTQGQSSLQANLDQTSTGLTAVTDETDSLNLAISNLGLLAVQNNQAIQTLTDRANATETDVNNLASKQTN